MPEAARSVGRPRRRLAWAAGATALVALACTIGWFATRGEELATLRGHTGPVRALAIDAELGYVVSAGDDATVRVWDVRTNRLVSTSEPAQGKLTSLAVRSPNLLGTGPDAHVRFWVLPSAMPVVTPGELPIDADCLAASADGRQVALGRSDGQIHLDRDVGRSTPRTFKAHGKAIHCLTFTPDGARLISGSSDGMVRVWDTASGAVKDQLAVGNRRVHGLVVSPDGARLFAAVAGAGLRGWALDRREELAAFGADGGMAWCVAVSPDGSRLASGHEDGAVKVWQSDPPGLLRTFRGHRSVALAVAFAPDGASLFSASGDGTVRRWKVPRP